jgi:UDP-N-acetylglucosamine 2-epimerase (non-hydrolysing)
MAVFIVGTRAQLIKVAPVIVACERLDLACALLMTGQHHDTMRDLLAEFGVRAPLYCPVSSLEHATVTSLVRWLPGAYRATAAQLRRLAADGRRLDVLVHGDTLSTLLGAWAGRRRKARVIHLESGLTSGRLLHPFPEELVRRIVFRMANVAACPNAAAARYMREHHPGCEIIDTHGNTILDAITLVGGWGVVPSAESAPAYIVVSLHRFQNIYPTRRLHALVSLIESLAADHCIRFVLHPATRKRLVALKLLQRLEAQPNIQVLPRLGYGAFLRLAAGAACVLTDGGSNQEELAALGVPTIVMRNETERSDGLGVNIRMEGDVPGMLAQYLSSGRYQELISPAAVVSDQGPSARIAKFLAAGR